MESKRRPKKHLSLIIVKRCAIFFAAMCFTAAFFIVAGSLSDYLDETQLALLAVLRWSSLGLVVVAICGALSAIVLALLEHYDLRLPGLLGYAAAAALGACGLAFADALVILSRGLR